MQYLSAPPEEVLPPQPGHPDAANHLRWQLRGPADHSAAPLQHRLLYALHTHYLLTVVSTAVMVSLGTDQLFFYCYQVSHIYPKELFQTLGRGGVVNLLGVVALCWVPRQSAKDRYQRYQSLLSSAIGWMAVLLGYVAATHFCLALNSPQPAPRQLQLLSGIEQSVVLACALLTWLKYPRPKYLLSTAASSLAVYLTALAIVQVDPLAPD